MGQTLSDEAIERALPALRRMVERYEARLAAAKVAPEGESHAARADSSSGRNAVAS